MDLNIFETNGHVVAEVVSFDTIKTTQDAFDLMATAYYQSADHILLHEKHLMPDFFDLKTGIAGDILQKFSNYQMRLTIMGDFEGLESESLRAFIVESNRGNQIAFVEDRQAALEKIANPLNFCSR